MKSAKTRIKLAAAREQILQNPKMGELDCDTPLPIPIDELRLTPDYPRLIEACERWELKSVLQEVRDEATKAGVVRQGELSL